MTTTEHDVVDVLTTDHREVVALVEQIPAADPGRRRDLADTLIAELMRHAVAEEMHVYPAMREHLPDGEAAVAHDVEEHQQLEEAMKDLEGLDSADPRFLEVLGRLESVLRDHVQDEETEQFPQLRAHVPHDRLVEMAGKVETAKKVAPTRPHPGAPRRSERADLRGLEHCVLHALEEAQVLWIGAGPAALDVVDTEGVEALGDADLVLHREGHTLALGAIAEGGVVDLDLVRSGSHRHGGAIIPPAPRQCQVMLGR